MDSDLAVRYGLGLVMLAGALVPDLKVRRVPNLWWVPFATVAVLLLAADLVRDPAAWPMAAVAVALCAAFYGLWRLHMFGGADAKALMVLALLVPRTAHPDPLPIPPAADALANGSLLMVAIPLAFFAVNAVRGDWAPAMFLGVRMDLARAERRHVWPMQWAHEDGALRWRYWRMIGLDLDPVYAGLRRAGLTRVWATPKIPLIGALLAGLALSVPYGNLVARLAALVALGTP